MMVKGYEVVKEGKILEEIISFIFLSFFLVYFKFLGINNINV